MAQAAQPVVLHVNPDVLEPAGMKIKKRRGENTFTGLVVETFISKTGSAVYRGVYDDGMSHDLGLRMTEQAMNEARSDVFQPSITVLVYDQSSNEKMGATKHDDGSITVKYKNTRRSDVVDLDDPFTMGIARDFGLGPDVGMVISRFSEFVDGEKIEKYRVIFTDGQGYLTDRDGVKQMHDLFVEIRAVPIVVSITGIYPGAAA